MDSAGDAMPETEAPLDALAPTAALARLLQGQRAALAAVEGAVPDLADAATRMAASLRGGARVVYAGAGSSGLMAMADALELPGTFGIPAERVGICMAGGLPGSSDMPGDTEDDTGEGAAAAAAVQPGDTAIVLSASGTTPYALSFAKRARSRGATVVGVANVPGSALLALADVTVCLPTAPEPLAGSTRMGAGTAQKAALNMISTLVGVLLGHVHDGQMVNLRADNAKLRARARGMVADIAQVPEDTANTLLRAAGGEVKTAILLAAGARDAAGARRRLDRAGGNLKPALAGLAGTSTPDNQQGD